MSEQEKLLTRTIELLEEMAKIIAELMEAALVPQATRNFVPAIRERAAKLLDSAHTIREDSLRILPPE